MRRLLKQEVEEYVDKLREKVVQDGNTTQIGGNLEVDGTVISNTKIESNLITGNEIVEKMSGYSFIKSPTEGQYYDLSYVGVCKNGNKITFVIAGKMNIPDNTQIYGIGNFIVPDDIGTKLFPIIDNQIAFLSVNAQITYNSRVVISGIFNKNSTRNIDVRLYAAGLTVNTDYYFRIEQTFLLSDNLAQ